MAARNSAFFVIEDPEPSVMPIVHQVPSHASFDPTLLSGRVTAVLEAEQQLHIGSGQTDILPNNSLRQYLKFARIGNALVIPGSTLKGVVRSYAEALSFSCYQRECFMIEDRAAHAKGPCPACAIFGSTASSGRVSFSDAPFEARPTIERIAQREAPPDDSSGRKFYYFESPAERKDRSEWIEVVPVGTRVATRLDFLNLRDWELGLVLLAMGLGSGQLRFSLKMGGAKNRSMGRIRFDDACAIAIDRQHTIRVISQSLNIEQLITAYLKKCNSVTDFKLRNAVVARVKRLKQ